MKHIQFSRSRASDMYCCASSCESLHARYSLYHDILCIICLKLGFLLRKSSTESIVFPIIPVSLCCIQSFSIGQNGDIISSIRTTVASLRCFTGSCFGSSCARCMAPASIPIHVVPRRSFLIVIK